MAIVLILEYGIALDPSYYDMVKRTWCPSVIGFASGEPGGHPFKLSSAYLTMTHILPIYQLFNNVPIAVSTWPDAHVSFLFPR